MRIRNPWENEVEWNGPWLDYSPEWIDRLKHKLKYTPLEKYGILWMSWEYFQINFIVIYVCWVYPDEMHHYIHGQWHGCSIEAWKKRRKENPEIHEEKTLATWGPDVPDDFVPDKRFLEEVNR